MVSQKYCIVPMCKSSTRSTPKKLFLTAPRNKIDLLRWCTAMKRDPLPETSAHFICEDHFDLEKDVINYLRFKLTGKKCKFFVKKGVLPHRFECQKGKESEAVSPEHAAKKNFKRLLKQNNTPESLHCDPPSPQSTSDSFYSRIFEPEVVIKEEPVDNTENPASSISDHDFTLQSTDYYQPSNSPILKKDFAVVKTEPEEKTQPITSNYRSNITKAVKDINVAATLNGRTNKRNKRKASEKNDVVAKHVSSNGRTPKYNQRIIDDPKTDVKQSEYVRPTQQDSASSKPKDSFDEYGEYVADELRNLDVKSCISVRKIIAGALLDAYMGKFK